MMTSQVAAAFMDNMDEQVKQRHSSVLEFLRQRDLSPDWLDSVIRSYCGDGQLLLTSSPVHGLANRTSDLDFIHIQEAPIDGPRISTKVFELGNHLEVVSFSSPELQRNLNDMHQAAQTGPGNQLALLRNWDRTREPRRKPTERIINGLTLDGTAPYIGHLPALAILWSRGSLQSALEHLVYLSLSEAAGESRGKLGYAYNALLHLMDALMCLEGDVYTTRKFYLLRWARRVASDGWTHDSRRTAAGELDGLRARMSDHVGGSARRGTLAGSYLSAGGSVLRSCESADVSVEIGPKPTARMEPYLPGSSLMSADGASVMTRDGVAAHWAATGLGDMDSIGTEQATALLRMLRAGVAEVRISYQDGDKDE
jgi:hypothetical protein